jgi:hypothetical protein
MINHILVGEVKEYPEELRQLCGEEEERGKEEKEGRRKRRKRKDGK